ncbi:MAG: hypothetical protein E5X61_27025, partial [Mesorhizobium sp.]
MWRRRRFPRGPVRARSDLCCRRSAHPQRLAPRREPA